jgi:hypothetical protein
MSTYSTSRQVNGSSHPLNGRLRATVGVLYPGFHGLPVTTEKSIYDQFPPVANRWETMHPIPDMAPPLLAEEERPPT